MRSALLIPLGVAIPVTAALLSLSEAAQLAGLAIAILVVGLGLAGTASSGRGTVPVSQQAGYDLGLALGLAGAARAVRPGPATRPRSPCSRGSEC